MVVEVNALETPEEHVVEVVGAWCVWKSWVRVEDVAGVSLGAGSGRGNRAANQGGGEVVNRCNVVCEKGGERGVGIFVQKLLGINLKF